MASGTSFQQYDKTTGGDCSSRTIFEKEAGEKVNLFEKDEIWPAILEWEEELADFFRDNDLSELKLVVGDWSDPDCLKDVLDSQGARKRQWKYNCPKCGEKAGARIVCGYPGPDLTAAEKRGEVALGGCCIAINQKNPTRRCLACGHEWGELKSSRSENPG